MADVRHRLITEGELHSPKGFTSAGNYTEAIRDENGVARYKKSKFLEDALNFVDGNAAPPTEVLGAIYVLIDEGNGTVDAGWDGVNYNEWCRFNGVEWVGFAPSEGIICYDATANFHKIFNGTSWLRLIPIAENISNADLTWAGNTTQDLDGNELAFIGGLTKFDSVELTATDRGMLFNRVSTAQMNGIASPTTNEVVYNTDLNALMRYDGAAWVTMAAGYGLVSVNDSSGQPTFYATLKAAYDNATSGQVVTLRSDIEVTTEQLISLKNNVNIDLNGYTYTYNVADGSDVFNAFSTVLYNCAITNGKIIRKNGTGGEKIVNAIRPVLYINLQNVNFENEDGACLTIHGTADAYGSSFIGDIASIANDLRGTINGGYLENKGSGGNYVINANNTEMKCDSGDNEVGGQAFAVEGNSDSGYGLYPVGAAAKVYNSVGESNTSDGIHGRNGACVYNCTGISNSSVGIRGDLGTGIVEMFFCTGISNSGTGIRAGQNTKNCIAKGGGSYAVIVGAGRQFKNSSVENTNDVAGGGISSTHSNCEIINVDIKLAHSGSYGVNSANRDNYITGVKLIGSSNLINWGSGSNLWIATEDAQGNSAQL